MVRGYGGFRVRVGSRVAVRVSVSGKVSARPDTVGQRIKSNWKDPDPDRKPGQG